MCHGETCHILDLSCRCIVSSIASVLVQESGLLLMLFVWLAQCRAGKFRRCTGVEPRGGRDGRSSLCCGHMWKDQEDIDGDDHRAGGVGDRG